MAGNIAVWPTMQADGFLHMAVDEVLLHQAEQGYPSFRLYQWAEPTLSIGYFQCAADRLQDSSLAQLPFVRRMTGGGAIVHGQAVKLASGETLSDWTYALALPARVIAGKSPCYWHDVSHQALCRVLRRLGLQAEWLPRSTSCQISAEEIACSASKRNGEAMASRIFLCFARPAPGDVVWQGDKVVGSAQRLRRGALLQHGSIFLPHGLADSETLARDWLQELGWLPEPGTWSKEVLQFAQQLAKSKYRDPGWNFRR